VAGLLVTAWWSRHGWQPASGLSTARSISACGSNRPHGWRRLGSGGSCSEQGAGPCQWGPQRADLVCASSAAPASRPLGPVEVCHTWGMVGDEQA
jgi:hypothetical protein